MLVSLTRVGASRQRFDKTFAVVGVKPDVVTHAFAQADLRLGGERLRVSAGVPGLFAVGLPMSWLGTRPARGDVFTELASVLAELATIAERIGGVLVPAGVAPAPHPAVPGGDLHVLEVIGSVEQEVLCNLLRSCVPALIAMTGRGVTVSGGRPDRVGSRWLAGSTTHLATRFLASTASDHLDRVKAELRRRDGVAQLDRMDISPVELPDGGRGVVVRCLESAPTLAAVRAQALVLSALAMRARRLVRDGRRAGHEPQRTLEENRARAVADGFRARFVVEERPRGQTGRRPETSRLPARDAVRRLLQETAVEFRGLDAGVDELAPFLLAVDLAGLGLRNAAAERDLLTQWAGAGDVELVARCRGALTDSNAGGPLLAELTAAAPGRVAVVLGEWRRTFADAVAERPPKRTSGRSAADRQQRRRDREAAR
ncbi:hypothetical protein AB0M80_24095 [Amycolatopsis sp. NPDC051045]|uniref:hypothetical protein n=1 Tax=Amycolatopsis sp. NPDC051045 TaxID=3156922 RepID=UPI0034347237